MSVTSDFPLSAPGAAPPKLLDRVRAAIRLRHYSRRTEESYVGWIRRFILFHKKRHPKDMGGAEVAAFLTHLAVRGRVSASTQNQALSALLFLYRHVLDVRDLGSLDGLVRAKRPVLLPVVLTRDEVAAVLARLEGVMWIIATLLYGSGLRLRECLELRVKDVDFGAGQVVVRGGKGRKDRVTPLPSCVVAALRRHLVDVREQHRKDLAAGVGRVAMPEALDRKYPEAAGSWLWRFVFPAARVCRDPRWGPPSRYHLHESAVQRAVVEAARRAMVSKRVSCHTSGFVFRLTCLAA